MVGFSSFSYACSGLGVLVFCKLVCLGCEAIVIFDK